jgi:hypothetical protein
MGEVLGAAGVSVSLLYLAVQVRGDARAKGDRGKCCVIATSDSGGYVKFPQKMRPWHQ